MMPARPRDWAAMGSVAAVTFMVFLPALSNGFVNWDDQAVLLDNDNYRGLDWHHVRWMFTTRLMAHFQPLTWFTYALDYKLWGLNPRGYHLTSLLFHAAAAGMFFWVARHLLHRVFCGNGRSYEVALTLAAALAALFFAIHPLRVESVAWATERRDVTSGLFFMISIAGYLRAAARSGTNRIKWLAVSLLAYVLSLMGKATGMTLPFVLVVLDAHPLARLRRPVRSGLAPPQRSVWIEKLPYLAIGVAAGINAFLGQYHSATQKTIVDFSWLSNLSVAAYATVFYVCKTFVPFNLSPLYVLNEPVTPQAWYFVLSIALVLSISVAVVAFARRAPAGLAVWACYLIILGPVSGLIRVGLHLAADRYTYLSCLSWAILVAGAWLAIGLHRNDSTAWRPARFLAVVTALAILGMLALLTQRQVAAWRDTGTLWEQAIRADPRNAKAHSALAGWLSRTEDIHPALQPTGTRMPSRDDLRLAEAHLKTAIQFKPYDPLLLANLSAILVRTGRPQEAIRELEAALARDPHSATLLNNLGAIQLAQERPDQAAESFRRAIESDSSGAPARINLIKTLILKKRYDLAIQECHAALKLAPDQSSSYYSLWGSALMGRGDIDGALPVLRKALELDPNCTAARLNLARIHEIRQHYDSAIRLLEGGLTSRRPDPAVMAAMAKVLMQCPNPDLRNPAKALTWAQQAAQATGTQNVEYLEVLATALAANELLDQAASVASRASQIAREQNRHDVVDRLSRMVDELRTRGRRPR